VFKIFGNKRTKDKIKMENWNSITSDETVKSIVEKSHQKPQIIFKHSVTCGISAYARSRIEDGYDHIEGKADFNYLDLLAYRSVSNFIAEHLGVFHQSPQIIILKNGEVSHTVTHHSIDASKIAKEL
jgi:bacillithiol system protein YtxJ